MSRTPTILGQAYDAPAELPVDLQMNGVKRSLVQGTLRSAEEAGNAETAQLMYWELGLIDLLLVTAEGVSPYRGGTYEQYAEFYRFTPDTVAYARERAGETQDLVLKLHYLEFVLLRSKPTGREWVQLQRELLAAYRDFVEASRASAANDPECFVGIYIEHALIRIGHIISRPGLVSPADAPQWAEWVVQLAEDSRVFPVKDASLVAQQRHRWIADYLVWLTSLSSEAVEASLRERALGLLRDAAAYYAATPLNDHFEHVVAQVEADLRKHWGEEGTHRQMILRQFETTVRRADFHKGTGNGLLTATFYRQARALVEEHRQYFTGDDVARLQRAEQEALNQGIEGGEFKRLGFSIEIPKELMDYVRDTPEATVDAIAAEAARAIPDRERIRKDVLKDQEIAPLSSLIGRTVVGPGKVVAQSVGSEGNTELDVEFRATLQTQLLGSGVSEAVQQAAKDVNLTPEHLLAPLAPLALDAGTLELIRNGLERLLAGDSASATHILIPHVEDALRQYLRALGVDTTEYVTLKDGTSRTDDATLGTLLFRKVPDGRSVREYMGSDLWDHFESVLNSQTGLNLRNEFAHGLARPGHCTPTIAAIALLLLYQLASRATKQD